LNELIHLALQYGAWKFGKDLFTAILAELQALTQDFLYTSWQRIETQAW